MEVVGHGIPLPPTQIIHLVYLHHHSSLLVGQLIEGMCLGLLLLYVLKTTPQAKYPASHRDFALQLIGWSRGNASAGDMFCSLLCPDTWRTDPEHERSEDSGREFLPKLSHSILLS